MSSEESSRQSQASGLRKRKDEKKRKADLTMCRVGREKESPLLVRLQVHLTKGRHEAQHA